MPPVLLVECADIQHLRRDRRIARCVAQVLGAGQQPGCLIEPPLVGDLQGEQHQRRCRRRRILPQRLLLHRERRPERLLGSREILVRIGAVAGRDQAIVVAHVAGAEDVGREPAGHERVRGRTRLLASGRRRQAVGHDPERPLHRRQGRQHAIGEPAGAGHGRDQTHMRPATDALRAGQQLGGHVAQDRGGLRRAADEPSVERRAPRAGGGERQQLRRGGGAGGAHMGTRLLPRAAIHVGGAVTDLLLRADLAGRVGAERQPRAPSGAAAAGDEGRGRRFVAAGQRGCNQQGKDDA